MCRWLEKIFPLECIGSLSKVVRTSIICSLEDLSNFLDNAFLVFQLGKEFLMNLLNLGVVFIFGLEISLVSSQIVSSLGKESLRWRDFSYFIKKKMRILLNVKLFLFTNGWFKIRFSGSKVVNEVDVLIFKSLNFSLVSSNGALFLGSVFISWNFNVGFDSSQ